MRQVAWLLEEVAVVEPEFARPHRAVVMPVGRMDANADRRMLCACVKRIERIEQCELSRDLEQSNSIFSCFCENPRLDEE